MVLRIIGFILDQRIDDHIETFGRFDSDGVLQGSEPRSSVSQKETAVIFIHGFTDTPQVFDEIIEKLSWHHADWFVPLLPFHGRSVHEMKDFDPSVVENYLSSFIEMKNRSYKNLVLIGQSLGGAVLIRLAQAHHWSPERVHLILMAPSVFLYTGHWWYHVAYNFYLYFRNYWPGTPKKRADALLSGLVLQAALAYYAIPAVKRLQHYSQRTEKILRQMTFPHTVLIAKDDNRVNTRQVRQICQRPLCHLILFEKGQHLLYQGEPVSQVVEQIGKAIESTLVSKS